MRIAATRMFIAWQYLRRRKAGWGVSRSKGYRGRFEADAPEFGVAERVGRQDATQAADALLALEALVLRERPVQVLLDLLGRRRDRTLVVVEDLLVDARVGEAQVCSARKEPQNGQRKETQRSRVGGRTHTAIRRGIPRARRACVMAGRPAEAAGTAGTGGLRWCNEGSVHARRSGRWRPRADSRVRERPWAAGGGEESTRSQ